MAQMTPPPLNKNRFFFSISMENVQINLFIFLRFKKILKSSLKYDGSSKILMMILTYGSSKIRIFFGTIFFSEKLVVFVPKKGV